MIHLFPCGKNDQKYILQTAGRMNKFLDGQTNGRITNVLSTPDYYFKIIHHLLHSEDAIYNIFFDLYTDARKIFSACLCSMAAILKNGRHF